MPISGVQSASVGQVLWAVPRAIGGTAAGTVAGVWDAVTGVGGDNLDASMTRHTSHVNQLRSSNRAGQGLTGFSFLREIRSWVGEFIGKGKASLLTEREIKLDGKTLKGSLGSLYTQAGGPIKGIKALGAGVSAMALTPAGAIVGAAIIGLIGVGAFAGFSHANGARQHIDDKSKGNFLDAVDSTIPDWISLIGGGSMGLSGLLLLTPAAPVALPLVTFGAITSGVGIFSKKIASGNTVLSIPEILPYPLNLPFQWLGKNGPGEAHEQFKGAIV